MLNLLPKPQVSKITKEEVKEAKSTHSMTMIFRNDPYKCVVNYIRRNVTRDAKAQSLRNL